MEKSVLDIIDILRHQKQVLTTSDVRDTEGVFVKYLGMYQVLPRPYLGSFDSGPGEKLI